MANTIVDLAVKKLVNKGYGAFKTLTDIESEVKRLQNTSTLIEAAINDNAQHKTIENLSCELDRLTDFFDTRATRAIQKEVKGGSRFMKEARLFFSTSNQLATRVKDAGKVKDIRRKLDSIVRDHDQFGNISGNLLPTSQTRAGSSHNIVTDMVIGRDGDRDNIIRCILSDHETVVSETLSVASIVGIGGVGKTTLAWYVYNNERVRSCFDAQFWVSANQNFNFKEVLEKIIITSGTNEKVLDCEMDKLYHYFHRAMGGKKFLLVLDNIWDQDDLRVKWLELRRLLAFGENGSKVLITTRSQKAAGVMDSYDPYMLQDLTKRDSWLLFQRIAFTQWQEPGVEVIGMEISKMCPNLPLVIQSIAGLLAGKRTVQEWQAFRDDQLSNFTSYGRDIMSTLKLSYDQLDARLKLCVTYCTLFPKGVLFTNKMIHRWISLEYVEPQYKNQSLEEAGKEYVISLTNCGFFTMSNSEGFDYLTNFKMHDVMYELVLSLAGFKYKVADSDTNEFNTRVRHVSLCKVAADSSWELPSSLLKIKHLQSFIMATCQRHEINTVRNWSISNKLLLKFQSLRVLDLQGVGIKELPTSVGQLISLRYLDLSETQIVKLPNSISRLVNLLSLYLYSCGNLKELPRDMSKLVNLRHLQLQGTHKLTHMPTGLGNLTNLTTLDVFIVGESKANVMGKLKDLNQLNHLSGELRIEVLRESKDIVSSDDIGGVNLKMKKKLKKLSISFEYGTKEDEKVLDGLLPPTSLRVLEIEGFGGERLPAWMMNQLESYLPNLVAIEISNCKGCKYLCSLGRLPYLKGLTFDGLDIVEYIDDNTSSGNASNSDNIVNELELPSAPLFPNLKSLIVFGMPKLKGWWRMLSSSELFQVQQHQNHHHLVNWKPTFPKLNYLVVDGLESAITISKQGGFSSVETLNIYHNYKAPNKGKTILLNSCFSNLQSLYLHKNNEVEVLPEEIRDLSSLKTLKIAECGQLKAIPEWIDSLTSLIRLYLSECARLESLPQQISNLPNLTTLSIEACPVLSERCKSPNGIYWPFIQHIPHLYST